jgi:hypothetical protein
LLADEQGEKELVFEVEWEVFVFASVRQLASSFVFLFEVVLFFLNLQIVAVNFLELIFHFPLLVELVLKP